MLDPQHFPEEEPGAGRPQNRSGDVRLDHDLCRLAYDGRDRLRPRRRWEKRKLRSTRSDSSGGTWGSDNRTSAPRLLRLFLLRRRRSRAAHNGQV